ncbi:HD domain-containing protein [Candidatus Woesearchaeota archaeon]|nr:HD domain-containing protein [Candidatus Woesearchaeota archaeon]MBW3016145.1 HD domain-containing protein [Candidatus Woesearchaeota archaeon]
MADAERITEKLLREKEGHYFFASDVIKDVYGMIHEGAGFVNEAWHGYYGTNQGLLFQKLLEKSRPLHGPETLRKLLELQVCLKDRSLGFKDGLIKPHNCHVEIYSNAVCRSLGYGEFKTERVTRSGEFHDIGKIAIPDGILNKDGPLTDDERARYIRPHPDTGASMLSLLAKLFGAVLDDIIENVRHHHEWYSGAGYPGGLRATEIPLGAQIISVADVFDALTSRRPYKEPASPVEALEIMASEEGHFNPDLLEHAKKHLLNAYNTIHNN